MIMQTKLLLSFMKLVCLYFSIEFVSVREEINILRQLLPNMWRSEPLQRLKGINFGLSKELLPPCEHWQEAWNWRKVSCVYVCVLLQHYGGKPGIFSKAESWLNLLKTATADIFASLYNLLIFVPVNYFHLQKGRKGPSCSNSHLILMRIKIKRSFNKPNLTKFSIITWVVTMI